MGLQWRCLTFDALDRDLLYQVMALREAVFIVEQRCAYQDLDGLDQFSYHVVGLSEEGELLAYARIIFPDKKYKEPAIGRVLTALSVRRQGYGRELIHQTLKQIEKTFPESAIRLSAQLYLESFYQSFGFETVSAPYNEDNIPHIEMLKKNYVK